MDEFLIKAVQFIMALSLLVLIHELGHYLFARLFGIKVDKFYLFFNPWFKIASWKPKQKPGVDPEADGYKPTWRDTEYGIGWLPLGGYCAIAGMIDENIDTNNLASEPRSWEFRSKPAWQRLLVMMGGVIFNFILAIIIYAGIAFHYGEKYIEYDQAYAGMEFTELARSIGFRNGDIPLTADGVKIDAGKPDNLLTMLSAAEVRVKRGADTVAIAIPENFLLRLNDEKGFMAYRQPVVVDNVLGGEPAAEAGIEPGDHIVAIGGTPTPSFTELTKALQANAGREIAVTVERDGRVVTLDATPTEGGRLGFQLKRITDIYPTVVRHFTLLESFPKGWELGTTMLSNYAGSMKLVFTKEGAQSLGGFGSLGNMFPTRWSWLAFWEVTAFLSVALAFMNFLPIPALDGGHIMFLMWEVVTRRKVPENVLATAQMIGMGFLILLLLYANGNDIFRFFIK